MTEQINLNRIDNIVLEEHKADPENLIHILQEINSEYGYLPESSIRRVAERLEIPLSHVYSVATFYKALSLEPRGKHLISVCLGTACHVRGAGRILEKLERDLHIKTGETTKDFSFTLETVNCLGACALGPVVVIDGEYFGQMTSSKVESMIKKYQKQTEVEEGSSE